MSELVQLKLQKIMQTRAYTMILLGTDEKSFAIYAEPTLGRTIQATLAKGGAPRPPTHSLLSSMLHGLRARVKQVVINEAQDSVFLCRIFLEHDLGERRHIVEVDGRPSDCLTLALLHEAPVYCTRAVLEQAVAAEV